GVPSLSVGDVSANEGNSGTTAFTFTVSLSAASGQAVTVGYSTADGTAAAGSDRKGAAEGQTVAPGRTSQTVKERVNGDALNETDEPSFFITASPPTARVGGGRGQGASLTDDGVPSLSVGDVSANEGNSGTTAFTFTVTLSAASGQAVTVGYSTADGTAAAG